MKIINSLASILESGSVPEDYDEKVLKKLSKKYQKLENRRVVHLYPIRSVTFNDTAYCLYACPLKGTEIDEATMQTVKAEADKLEVGNIRYNSVMSIGDLYYIIDSETGQQHIDKELRNAVTDLSDCFTDIILFSKQTSTKKASQLNCHYAMVGIRKHPDGYTIEAIPNSAIGLATGNQKFEFHGDGLDSLTSNDNMFSEEKEAPAVEKYKLAMTVLSVIITIAILVWYFLLK